MNIDTIEADYIELNNDTKIHDIDLLTISTIDCTNKQNDAKVIIAFDHKDRDKLYVIDYPISFKSMHALGSIDLPIGLEYKHLKTGNIYNVITLNANHLVDSKIDDPKFIREQYVVYYNHDIKDKLFVREFKEFNNKFICCDKSFVEL